jgi:hypothetical protein
MPDGFRILENGDYRISEASDSRITERFDEAHTDLNATGSIDALAITTAFAFTDAIGGEGIFSATPILTVRGLTDLQGTGSITADGTRTTFGAFSLSASGTLVNDPQIGKFAYADLQGSSSFASDATVVRYEVSCEASSTLASSADKKLFGFADLQTIGTHLFAGDRFIGHTHNFEAFGTVSADGLVTRPASTSLNATGSVSTIGTYKANGVVGLTGTGTLSQIGGLKLSGATSLAAEGDFSYGLFPIPTLTLNGKSNLTATGSTTIAETLDPFVTEIYVKQNDTWKDVVDPYVKHNGTWKIPQTIYKKVSGSWQRVH